MGYDIQKVTVCDMRQKIVNRNQASPAPASTPSPPVKFSDAGSKLKSLSVL